MTLFGKKEKEEAAPAPQRPAGMTPLVGKKAFCTICNDYRQFSRVWKRTEPVRQCTCCGTAFENVGQLYAAFQPKCPRCAEFLEHPGFDYGLCDACGSKFELVDGAKPGFLPNLQQRQHMSRREKGLDRKPLK